MTKMKLKINDKVTVIAGKDKGKSGKIIQVMPILNKVVVEGVNTMYKHIRGRKSGEKGQRVQFNGPIAVSNTMLLCPSCSKPTRLGYKIAEGGKTKQRFCKKCKAVIA